MHKSYNDTTFVQNIEYDYNIKGMLTSINNPDDYESEDLFAMNFEYYKNGNISQTEWISSQNSQLKTYNFDYDNLNRLTQATYEPNNKYDVNIEYDKNGNITDLSRKGQIKNTVLGMGGPTQVISYGLIDSLSYNYIGNQLKNVNDYVTDIETDLNNDFRDNGITMRTEYTYDENGNMLTDYNKSLNIEYNFINQPTKVIKDQSNRTEYIYTAGGTKLQSKIIVGGLEESKTDYCGQFVYENNVLSYIITEVGRITIEYTGDSINIPPVPTTESEIHYEYNITDHLGNIRAVFNDEGDLLQENAYYPFGMRMNGQDYQIPNPPNSQNPYSYNGKELQTQTNYLDYGFRQLDPQLGRWHCVDKLAEMYSSVSPYAYALNDPVNNIDVAGLMSMPYVNQVQGDYAGTALGANPAEEWTDELYSIQDEYFQSGAGTGENGVDFMLYYWKKKGKISNYHYNKLLNEDRDRANNTTTFRGPGALAKAQAYFNLTYGNAMASGIFKGGKSLMPAGSGAKQNVPKVSLNTSKNPIGDIFKRIAYLEKQKKLDGANLFDIIVNENYSSFLNFYGQHISIWNISGHKYRLKVEAPQMENFNQDSYYSIYEMGFGHLNHFEEEKFQTQDYGWGYYKGFYIAGYEGNVFLSIGARNTYDFKYLKNYFYQYYPRY